MNRQEFLKAGKQYLQYFKPREDDVESVIRQKCNENDTDINAIIDFAKWVEHISLKKTETKSDDILDYNITLCVDYSEFWNDIGRTVFYGGYIKGLAGIIKTIYVSTDGKFYDNKHNLIAANEEDFFDYLLSVEFDFHPVIKECVYDALRKAGWYEGRCVDITELNAKFNECNIFLSKAQLDFLREFSGITVKDDSNGYKCRFLSAKKILNDQLPNCNNNGRRRDDYSLCVIVSDAADFSYYLKPNGIITFCGIPLGRTTMECINHVIKNLFCWSFDIDEPINNPIKPE